MQAIRKAYVWLLSILMLPVAAVYIVLRLTARGLALLTVLLGVLGGITLDAFHVTGLKVNWEVVEGVKGGDPLCVFDVLVGKIMEQAQ